MQAAKVDGARVPPGWYADPNGSTRWWDGRGWTTYLAPDPRPEASRPQAPSQDVDLLALVAMFLGFAPYLGIASVVLGPASLVRVRHNGKRGRIAGIIGTVLGALWTIAFIETTARLMIEVW